MKNLGPPDAIGTYFKGEVPLLIVVTVTGILYNIGMTAGPWFEGQLAQCLVNIIRKKAVFSDMLRLAVIYIIAIALVQFLRFLKRLYVRKFANSISRKMKTTIYANLVRKSRGELNDKGSGPLMTRAVSDIDVCVEGIRKFTTEIFDTGVVMAAYLVMLFVCDWRLALISCIFPPIAYIIAAKLKKPVTKSQAESKKSAGRLASASLESVSGAVTYRVYGQELNRARTYDTFLCDYEKKSIRANLFVTTTQPIYQVIAMISTIFILFFGGRNVMGHGWKAWDIAAFSTFLACFVKLANKTSTAAKLFNAVQKAEVSWGRIKPYMKTIEKNASAVDVCFVDTLQVKDLSVSFSDGKCVLENVSFSAERGQIIGITGEVASGKSILGRAFLGEVPMSGSICADGREITGCGIVAYMGHDPELLNDTIWNNVSLGMDGDVKKFLKEACIYNEVLDFPDGLATKIGEGGVRLSGGQKARIALSRTLMHKKPILVLDDPFSAVDMKTEEKLFATLRQECSDCIILLISHRLTMFPHTDGVLFLDHGGGTFARHKEMIATNPAYKRLVDIQTGQGGERHDE